MKKTQKRIVWAVVTIAIISGVGFLIYMNAQPGKYDALAKCVAEKEAIFYGAYWCPACNQQKAIFGKSAQYLPYVECSLPGGNGQNDICIAAKIEAYPTWQFTNGEKLTGVLSIEELAAKTSCEI